MKISEVDSIPDASIQIGRILDGTRELVTSSIFI